MARTTSVKITGNVTEALAALDALGIKAETTALKAEGAFTGLAEKSGGIFAKLGQAMAGIGLPFSESVAKMGEKMSDVEGEAGKFSEKLASVGKLAAGVGIAGFAVAAGEGVHLATAYQQATAQLAGSANISAAAAKQIGDAFLDTGGKTVFSAQEQMSAYQSVAAQLGTVEGHALTAAQAQEVMASAGDLAEASGASLDTTVSALAATMQAFGVKAKDAAGASDVLFNASRFLNLGVDEVSQTVDKLHGRLGVAMPNLADTGALMVELGQHGITGSRGAGVVTTAMTTLLGGSKQTNDELKKLGVSLFDSSGHFIGMQAAIQKLQPALAGMTQEQQLAAEKTLFGASAAQVMGQIIGDGVDKFDASAAAVSRSGSSADAAAAQNQSLGKQIEILKAAGEDLATKLGQALIPKIEEAAKVTEKIISWFEKHTTAAKILGGIIGGLLVAAIGAYAAHLAVAAARSVEDFAKMMASSAKWVAQQAIGFAEAIAKGAVWLGEHAVMAAVYIAQNIAMAASATAAFVAENAATLGIGAAIALLIAGIVLLATHWKQVWDDVKKWTEDAWKFIDGLIHNKFVQIAAVFVAPWLVVATHWKQIWDGIKGAVADAKNFISSSFDAIVGFVTGLPDKIAAAAKGMWHGISDAFKEAIDFIIRGWNSLHFKMPEINTHIPGIGKIGGFDIGLPQIPLLALGGLITQTGSVVVGDNGPELLTLPTGAMVQPLSGAGRGAAPVVINSAPVFHLHGTGPEIQRQIDASLSRHSQQLIQLLAARGVV